VGLHHSAPDYALRDQADTRGLYQRRVSQTQLIATLIFFVSGYARPILNCERTARSKPQFWVCAIRRLVRGVPLLYYPLFTPMYCRNWLLSASISSWTSWTSGNVQNHAVPNTSFRLSNSNPGRVDVVAFACEVRISRRVSLFIVDPNAWAPSRAKQGDPPTLGYRLCASCGIRELQSASPPRLARAPRQRLAGLLLDLWWIGRREQLPPYRSAATPFYG
jgi:hypothetical protein